jgi:zinc protease
VRLFHAAHYRPDRAVLVLAGDVDPARVRALASRLFGGWRAPRQPAATAQLALAASITETLVLVDVPGSGQSAVVVAAPFVAIDAPDRRAGQLANAALGGGYSARLNQEVRIKRGLAYGASSETGSHPGGGMFAAQTQTKNASAAEVLRLMRGEIARLADEAPGADELAARQAALVGSFARRLETTGGLAALVVAQLAQGRPLADLQRTVEEIMAVTPEQVRDFARAHWPSGALRGVVVGDLAAAGEPLHALPGLRVPIAELDLERRRLVKPPR